MGRVKVIVLLLGESGGRSASVENSRCRGQSEPSTVEKGKQRVISCALLLVFDVPTGPTGTSIA